MKERLLTALAWGSALVVSCGVVCLVGYVLHRGLGVIGPRLFFGDTDPLRAIFQAAPVPDGFWPACLGTLCLLGLASCLAIPIGIAGGIYMSEYASGRLKQTFSFGVDLLASVPSVVMGLFGFTLILFLRRTIAPQANTCLLLAAVCLALLILPYLVSATRTSLEELPEDLRLIGPSLGFTRWQVIRHILLPSASQPILGGVVLAMGRAAEDTAVILLTGVVANAGAPSGLFGKFEALPFAIYYLAAEHQNQQQLDQGFGAALVLLSLTGALCLGAHLLHAKLKQSWMTGTWQG